VRRPVADGLLFLPIVLLLIVLPLQGVALASDTLAVDTTAVVDTTTIAVDTMAVDDTATVDSLAAAAPGRGAPPPTVDRRAVSMVELWSDASRDEQEPVGIWKRGIEHFPRYAPRSWGDVIAALPLARADRFGPVGYFETFRIDGTGTPIVLFDAYPWPVDAGGLPNAGALPRVGVGAIELTTPRILPGLGVVAPGGALRLRSEPWIPGTAPRSFAAAERGGGGYRDYRFGFARDMTVRTSVQLRGQFRKADEFAIDSDRSFSSDLRFQFVPLSGAFAIRGGLRRYDDDQVLFDKTLQTTFSHGGSDERSLLFGEFVTRRMIGQLYRSRIHSAASAVSASAVSTSITDERTGIRVSSRGSAGPALVTATARAEQREAQIDGVRSEAGHLTASLGTAWSPAPWAVLRISALGAFAEGAAPLWNGEGLFLWEGKIPGLIRLARLREEPSLRRWVEGSRSPGAIRYGEIGATIPFLPGRPKIRYFRREGDSVDHRISVDAFFEERLRIDERTDGIEIGVEGTLGDLSWETSYSWIDAREKGSDERLPYHSDHLVRGRIGYAHAVPLLPAVPRFDLLGEWRSDRTAPGADEPMEAYYILRGRVTLTLRGTDLFAQMEQIASHQNEFLDRPGGADGVLSGTRQIYLGLYWPFED